MSRKNSPLTRIPALIVKELLTLFRDPKGRMVLITPPILQLLIFAYAATLEIKNVSIGILNHDYGKHGYEMVQRLQGSPTFTHIKFLKSQGEIKELVDEQEVMAIVTIPQDFSRKIEARSNVSLQVILDGRRSNGAQIVSNYIDSIARSYGAELKNNSGMDPPPTTSIARSWFNENLLYLWFTLPSLVAILSMLITLMITALSTARERELGTFDQLLVSPLAPYEILVGKTFPAILVGMCEGLMIFLIARYFFGVPFSGSILLFFGALLIFVISVVGVGLFISAISKTQQQAVLGAFVFMVPSVSLSGYAAPVENMPAWLQIFVEIIPLKHFLIITKGLFLKNMSPLEVWTNTYPLLIIGAISLPIAGWFFSKRME